MPSGDKAAFTQRLGKMDELREKLEKTMSPEQKAVRDQMFDASRKMQDPNFANLPEANKKLLADERARTTQSFGNSLSPEQKAMMDQMSDLRRANPIPQGATPTTRPPPYNTQVANFVAGLSPEQAELMDRLQQSNIRTLPEAERAFKDSLRPEQQQSFVDFQKLQLKRHGVNLAEPGAAPVTAAPVPAPAPASTPPASAPAPAGTTSSPSTAPATAAPVAAAAVSLHPQQHQAYLKSLGYEVGSLNDTTKNKDQIEAATRKFAVDNKIDPNDKAAVNKALQQKAMEGAAAQIDKTQFSVGAGKYSPEDVKVSQWLMKGQGRDMPKSTRADGTVDGIPGKETKTAMPETLVKLKADAVAPKNVTPSPVSTPTPAPAPTPTPDKGFMRPESALTVGQLEERIKTLTAAGVRADTLHPDELSAMDKRRDASHAFNQALSPEQRQAYDDMQRMPTRDSPASLFGKRGEPTPLEKKTQAEMDFLKTLTPEQRQKYADLQNADKHDNDTRVKHRGLQSDLSNAKEELVVRKFEDTLTPAQRAIYDKENKFQIFSNGMPNDPKLLATLSPEQKLLYLEADKAREDGYRRRHPIMSGVSEVNADISHGAGGVLSGRKDIEISQGLKDLMSRPNVESMGSLKVPTLATPGFNPEPTQVSPVLKTDILKL